MSATSIRTDGSVAASRLDALAYALLAILPLGMALLNKSAQPIMAASAIAALLARFQAGELPDVRERLVSALSSPIGAGALVFLAYGAISLGWGHHFRSSVSALAEVATAAGMALVLGAALPRRLPGWVVKLATIAIAVGCLTIMGELASSLTIRSGLGLRSQTFIFKRSATAMLMIAWPVWMLLWITGKRSIAVALGLVLMMATYAAHSSATALGLGVGLGAIAVAVASRQAASRLLAAMIAVSFVVAPFLGDAVDRFVPKSVVEKLDFAHGRERIDIWQSFGEVVKRRPVLGAGFGTSPRMAQEPVAAEVPDERRVMLGAWHPHNGYLQIWAELGIVGVMLAGATLLMAALRIGRASPARAVTAAAILASASAIMLVGHGAWQGWWATMIGAALVWLARMPVDDGATNPERLSRP